jgi:hypothetical protein
MYGWLAVEAVTDERLSTEDSLLTGKLTGNFAGLGPDATLQER